MKGYLISNFMDEAANVVLFRETNAVIEFDSDRFPLLNDLNSARIYA